MTRRRFSPGHRALVLTARVETAFTMDRHLSQGIVAEETDVTHAAYERAGLMDGIGREAWNQGIGLDERK